MLGKGKSNVALIKRGDGNQKIRLGECKQTFHELAFAHKQLILSARLISTGPIPSFFFSHSAELLRASTQKT